MRFISFNKVYLFLIDLALHLEGPNLVLTTSIDNVSFYFESIKMHFIVVTKLHVKSIPDHGLWFPFARHSEVPA